MLSQLQTSSQLSAMSIQLLLHTSSCLQVLLLNYDTKAQCTGTRIYPQWVLTAANCNPGYAYTSYIHYIITVLTHIIFPILF
jgi:hypothetical protein